MDRRAPAPGAVCGNCGSPLTAAVNFCPECGVPATPTIEAESRRTVTLLFTDVTGSTALGEQLDPETYRSVMGRYFAVAKAAIERHGGTVEKFVGDAVLAVFGVPDIREDDALRAVRAADELTTAVQALSQELLGSVGVSLAVRIGVNTGEVVTGAARAGGSFATGDAVNTAARLEQAAAPGEVLLGQDTWTLVRDAVHVLPVEPITAKGKSQHVPAYRLLDVRPEGPGRHRQAEGRLLGREREAGALQDAFERTLDRGRSHLVTVLGAPGIGKTRLVDDFVARIRDRADVARGRCASYGQGITFWPAVQVLRQCAALDGTETDEATRASLISALSDAADAETVAGMLMPLLGRSGQPPSIEDTFWAVRRLLEERASRRPLVVTVDDIHWAEPTLLELLEQVRDELADLPVLLVCQARPELLDHQPHWGTGSLDASTFVLDPLTDEQVGRSLANLLGEGVPDDVITFVAAWSGGNPLFVEEIAAHLVDTNRLRRGGQGWEVTGALDEVHMPPTVAALLAARLDRLPVEERLVLERASVVGVEVTTSDVLILSEHTADVGKTLATLARRDLLRRVRGGAEETWAFRHILVREAAYEALPKALRSELHERFAASIEGSSTDAGAERLAFASHHLEEAVRLRRELASHDSSVPQLTERAISTLTRAAQAARDRDDLPASDSLLGRALALGPASSAVRRDLIVRMAHNHQDQDQIARLADDLATFREALDDSADVLDRSLARCLELVVEAFESGANSDLVELTQVARTTADLAREAADPRRLTIALWSLIEAEAERGRWRAVEALHGQLVQLGDAHTRRVADVSAGWFVVCGAHSMRRLAELAGPSGPGRNLSPRHELRLQILRSMAAAALDEPGAAQQLHDAVATADRLPGGRSVDNEVNLATAFVMSGDTDAGVEWLGLICDRCRAFGNYSGLSTYAGWRAALMLERGDDLASVLPLVDEAARHTPPEDVSSLALKHSLRCVVEARQGHVDLAWRSALEAVRVVDSGEYLWQQADIRRWVSEAARLRGDRATERRLLEEALARYRTKELAVFAGRIEARLADW